MLAASWVEPLHILILELHGYFLESPLAVEHTRDLWLTVLSVDLSGESHVVIVYWRLVVSDGYMSAVGIIFCLIETVLSQIVSSVRVMRRCHEELRVLVGDVDNRWLLWSKLATHVNLADFRFFIYRSGLQVGLISDEPWDDRRINLLGLYFGDGVLDVDARLDGLHPQLRFWNFFLQEFTVISILES